MLNWSLDTLGKYGYTFEYCTIRCIIERWQYRGDHQIKRGDRIEDRAKRDYQDGPTQGLLDYLFRLYCICL